MVKYARSTLGLQTEEAWHQNICLSFPRQKICSEDYNRNIFLFQVVKNKIKSPIRGDILLVLIN